MSQSKLFLVLSISWAGLNSSCASRKVYNSIEPGQFKGSLNLQWIAPDKFVFIPDPEQPFQFIRSNGEVIEPKAMYTDGGSIPGLMKPHPDYSPMGYAPAYVIHDWLHFTHSENVKNGKSDDIKTSATILAEGIKTLMEEDNSIRRKPFIFNSIYQMMKSPFAEYATHITQWHADLPPPENVASMNSHFYTAGTTNTPSPSTKILKEKVNTKAIAELFFPHLPVFKKADKKGSP